MIYGAEVWGYIGLSALQTAEIRFCRTLLGAANSTLAFVVYQELGLYYISDLIGVRPLLLWLEV